MFSKQFVLLSSTKTGLSRRMKHTGALFPPLFSRYTSCSDSDQPAPMQTCYLRVLSVLSDSAPFGLRCPLMWRCLPRDQFGTGPQCLMAPLVSSSLIGLINPIKAAFGTTKGERDLKTGRPTLCTNTFTPLMLQSEASRPHKQSLAQFKQRLFLNITKKHFSKEL